MLSHLNKDYLLTYLLTFPHFISLCYAGYRRHCLVRWRYTSTRLTRRAVQWCLRAVSIRVYAVHTRHHTDIKTRSIWKMLGPFATASRRTPIHQMSLLHTATRTPPAHRSTTTTTIATTTRDRGDRYGSMEWAQLSYERTLTICYISLRCQWDKSNSQRR